MPLDDVTMGEIVIRSARLERLLERKYRAVGPGLLTKTNYVQRRLPEPWVRNLRFVAEVRNEAVHADTCTPDTFEKYKTTTDAIEQSLASAGVVQFVCRTIGRLLSLLFSRTFGRLLSLLFSIDEDVVTPRVCVFGATGVLLSLVHSWFSGYSGFEVVWHAAYAGVGSALVGRYYIILVICLAVSTTNVALDWLLPLLK